MSPYQQGVTDVAKQSAVRESQIAQNTQNLGAARQGTYGGARQTLAQMERERNLLSNLSNIQTQGSQAAYDRAMQTQQFGAGLGLQGLQAGYGGLGLGMQGAGVGLQGIGTALQGQQGRMAGLGQAGQFLGQGMQGAQTGMQGVQGAIGAGQFGLQGLGQGLGAGSALAQIGATQQGTDIARQNQMSTMGQQQQAFEQSKINQAIQDYATQQQYPLMQLGFMSNMLRGLPMQAATTQSYQAAPTPITQGLGLLAGAAGAKQAGLFKEGGTIRGLASGGVAGYANRGMVQANPSSGVVQGIRQKLEMMRPEQLQQVAQTSSSEEVRAMAIEILREKQLREQAESQAQQSIMQDQRSMPTPVSENMGLSAAPAGSMDMLSAASGGIVAFANEGEVELDPEEVARMQQEFMTRQKYEGFAKKQREDAGVGAPKAALADYYAKQQTEIDDAKKQARGYDLLNYGLNLATEAGPLGYAAARAGQKTLPGMISRQEELRGREKDVAKGLAEIAEGERLMKAGDITAGNAMYEKGQDRLNKIEVAQNRSPGNMMSYAQNYLAERMNAGDKRDQNTILKEGMDKYMSTLGASGSRADTAATVASTNARDKAVDNVTNTLTKDFNSPEAKQIRKLAKEDKKNGTNKAQVYKDSLVEKEMNRIQSGGSGGGGGGSSKPKVINLDKI
jgi:hypothetical protein